MRERKRLEGQLAMENELVRRMGDIDAYFELGREGESVEPDLEREIKSLSEFVKNSNPAPCSRPKPTRSMQS